MKSSRQAMLFTKPRSLFPYQADQCKRMGRPSKLSRVEHTMKRTQEEACTNTPMAVRMKTLESALATQSNWIGQRQAQKHALLITYRRKSIPESRGKIWNSNRRTIPIERLKQLLLITGRSNRILNSPQSLLSTKMASRLQRHLLVRTRNQKHC